MSSQPSSSTEVISGGQSPQIVILGCGIIGLSTAYYLADRVSGSSIHIVDPAPRLFDCASGKAGGFLAKDWFSSKSMLKLGALSLSEHERLALKYNGTEIWGYTKTIAGSPSNSESTSRQNIEDSWMWEGGSRQEVAPEKPRDTDHATKPSWLRCKGFDTISDEGSTAQIDPFRFCQFLLNSLLAKGVHVHHPASVHNVVEVGGNLTGVEYSSRSSPESVTTLACTHLLLAAGAWTPDLHKKLFPQSRIDIPVFGLAGWSIVMEDSVLDTTSPDSPCHAVFTSTTTEGFMPEFLTRSMPNSPDATTSSTTTFKRELWFGGLSSNELPLPDPSIPAEIPAFEDPNIEKLIRVSKSFLAPRITISPGDDSTKDPTLTVVRTGLCFRPVTQTGRPIISKIPLKSSRNTGLANATNRRGLFVNCGHGPWGIALSLGSGKIMADMMLNGDPERIWDSLSI